MYYSIPNLLSTVVTAIADPWAKVDPGVLPDTKEKFTDWSKNHHTAAHFISGFEGQLAGLRLGKDNGPHKMHCLIADFDTPCAKEDIKRLKVAAWAEFLPAYAVVTYSGYLRLIWQFENPVMLASLDHAKAFVAIMQKYLKMGKWHAGLDAPALGNPLQYYHIGRAWHELKPDSKIPSTHLTLWAYEAGKDLSFGGSTHKVPMDKLEAEVAKNYPGRWRGAFALGARGIRFWDPIADNPTGAIVRPDGMQCFTGPEPFVPWHKIFGQAFVDQFQATMISSVLDDVAYDGKSFWSKARTGRWIEMPREDFSRELRVKGFDSARARGKTYSAVDEMENAVVTTRRVARALPFIYFPSGIIPYKHELYLNTSNVVALDPAPPLVGRPMKWTDGLESFPFIYEFLNTMFNQPGESGRQEPQLRFLLAWMQYFYSNALSMTPKQGQAIVLAGPTGKGKTLFVTRVLGALMGDIPSDAASHLVEGLPWTDQVAQSPIMFIDDTLATGNPASLNRFSNMLKKYTSSATLNYNAKYKQTGQIPWYGRVVIACNVDSESLRILPNMDMSNREKVSLFKTSDHKMDFPVKEKTEKLIADQLPFFARFLLDWNMPEELKPTERRFGVRHYHHPDLVNEAQHQGTTGVVEDVLCSFLAEYQTMHPKLPYWSGSAAELYKDLSVAHESIMKDVKYHALCIALGNMQKNGRDVYRERSRTGLYSWRIGWDIFNGSTTTAAVAEEQAVADQVKATQDAALAPTVPVNDTKGTTDESI